MSNQKQNNSVAKMLTPEEMQLLGTMQSTLNELLSLQQGETPAEEVQSPGSDIMEALKKLAAENKPDGEGIPGQDKPVEKENNGPTANENAEQRSNAETDINDKNMSEVGKALLKILSNGATQSVTKSQPVNNYNNDIAKALGVLAKRLDSIEQFNSNMIDALGFSEKIEKSQELQKVNKSQNLPVQNIDATGVVNELVNVIKSLSKNQQVNDSQLNNDWNGMQNARKNLSSAMPFIFQNSLSNQKK